MNELVTHGIECSKTNIRALFDYDFDSCGFTAPCRNMITYHESVRIWEEAVACS